MTHPSEDRAQTVSPARAAEVAEYLAAHRDDVIAALAGWVRLRSVSGLPERRADLIRSANWLAGALREVGFPTAEVLSADGSPTVYAEWCTRPEAPTVLVYSHHDVRPAKDEIWEQTPPFDPALRDGRLFGRGASDAKGQIIAHLWGLRAHLQRSGTPELNLKVLVEGEEEIGSPHLAAFLDEHRDRFTGTDLIMVSDTMLWSAEHPAVCHGVRGSVQADLEIYGPGHDIHSGAVAGATVNPLSEMCRLLARLHDDDGRVAVPGFYDSVVELSDTERRQLRALPYDDEDWRQRSHTRTVVGEPGYTVPERIYARPVAEVLSMASGDPEGPSRGAIPAVATASITVRTVPDQRVDQVAEQLRRWVADQISDAVDYQLSIPEETGQNPYVTPSGHPALTALTEAMRAGFGDEVGHMRNAGAAPAALLSGALDAPVIFFGTGLPEDNWHDTDESIRIDMLLKGAATLTHLWEHPSLHP
ncbi:M20/M25/M40 family metallo-hydrolase [Actinomadura fibrosa]|uniref:M20/M25/M40 family metallo-hydrolase n=1 Tax=Actinomadura fibrosa TaxID=111802 RepID=A0ABW2XQ56_9ACTN|nr:M20/M25/M40 family metallo-hydrolase [Actinomadura fibrosa]